MTDIDSLAAALFGSKRAESQEVLTDATTRTYVGTALTDSKDGTVIVDLGGDVTLPDDIEGLAEYSADGVEVATGPGVRAGDEVVVTLVGGTPLKTPMVTGVAGEGDRQDERIHAIEADYVKATTLEADVAEIGFLKADSATIADLQADTAKVHDLTAAQLAAATGYVGELQAGSVSAQDIVAGKATVGELAADHVSVSDLDAATARIGDLEADHVSVSDFQAEQASIDSLQAATADIDTIRANSAKVQNLTAAQLEADHATIGTLDTTYMHANMSNSDVAWISNGTIKDGAITNAMINSVSANKLTAGTIDASEITVTNLNADNITTGTINGQRIGEGSLSLDKLSESVYTEAEVNNIVDGLNDRIDGAIETFTGTAVPTLNNQPASSWNTTKLRDEHVGDVYYVVNSQSQQNGYCYRFTKSGSTYSWQLIKDSDVTAALSRLTTAEGKITTFDSDISKLKTDTGTLTTKTESLETRMSDAEADILDKVDTTTFNEVSDTVDSHSQSITQMTTTLSNKADSSTVTTVTNRVSKNEQDISGINTTIGELQDTVETKADCSTVSTISNKLNTVSNTVDGHTQTLTSVQNTLSTKADSSTVSTLTTKVNNVSDTVDGHTSQLSSITTTQTTMQTALDKTVKSSIQLWYSKANTTAPNKPTSQVTSTSTNGNAWRIVVPAYNSSYPHYFYCWQYEYVDGTYGWSAVVRDIAMGESQSTARTADSNASAAVTTANTANTNASTALTTANTANTNASDAKTAAATASTNASEAKTTAETAASDASTAKTTAASAVTTANSASTTATNAQNTANANIKSSVQLWFTKANSTAPNKPTSVVSTSNANTTNAWNLVVPVWNKSYPHYFYCYQQQKGDGNYQWTDVVYDRATSEAQQLANTTSTNLSTLQEDYATYKQTTTENVSSIGTRLTTAEGKISTAETAIGQNTEAIALRATKTEVQQVRPAYASSSTAAGTAAKVATIDPAVTGYALYKGASVAVTFSTANTAATPTLNLNSTGAKQIRSYTGAALSEAEYKWAAGATIDLVYDGTYWRMQDGGSVKRVTAAEASIRVNADNIESKVSKDGVISSINQSAETVKIDASKVEIDGTAVFSAISSDVDDAITSKGYQTSSQVNSAITSKGYATTTQAQGYATTAKSEAISAAATDATSKANAAQTAATNAANTATDNKLKSYSTTAQANELYDAKGAAAAVETNSGNLFLGASMADRSTFINNSSTDFSRHFRYYNGSASIHSFSEYSPGVYQDTVTLNNSGNLGIAFARMADEMGLDSTSSYTITCWAKCSKAGMNLAIGLSYYNTSNSWVWRGGTNATAFSAADTWQKFSVTFKPDADTQAICYCFTVSGGTGSETFTIRNCWLEKNAAHDAQVIAENAAPKANAVKRTQRIWYRKSAPGAPATPGTASSNWVTKPDDGDNAWTKMHISISSSAKYIYTCEQYEMANGTVGYTSVLLDNTITVIDGGNIITGSVYATALNASDINASKSLTVGAMTDAAASTILNSNISVGGRNLLQGTTKTFPKNGTLNTYFAEYTVGNGSLPVAYTLEEGVTYTFSVDVESSVEPFQISIGAGTGGFQKDVASKYSLSNGRVSITFTPTATQLSSGTTFAFRAPRYATATNFTYAVDHPKLERGNKATDWTPAPEDQTSYVDDSVSSIQVGGRNLLAWRGSTGETSTSSSGLSWTYADDGWITVTGTINSSSAGILLFWGTTTATNYIYPAGTYTVTVENDGLLTANVLRAQIGYDGTYKYLYDSGSLTFAAENGISRVCLYRYGANGTSVNGRIRFKMERGNKATDWTPAPEDMATNTALAGTNESLEGAIADIGELSDQLVGTVSEQNKTITDIQTYLNSLRQDLDAEIQSRQQWLNFNSAEGLVIGAAGSSFKTVTTNTSQQFRSGGTVLAETSGTEFVAPIMRSDQLLIGNWMWTKRDNGNLSLKWIG